MQKRHYPWWGYVRWVIRQYPGRHGAPLNSVGLREQAAVETAVRDTARLEDGDSRLKVIDLVHWQGTHRIGGAALEIPCSDRTAANWQREFFKAVAKNLGLLE